jgi:mycothione reductase
MKMKNYDMIVIGTGCGSIISSEASEHGLKVAVVDKGPFIGGTCLNLGCIPSKMLIHVADQIADIQQSGKLGIKAEIKNVDFLSIMERMRSSRKQSQKHIREGFATEENIDFYEGKAQFIKDHTLDVNGETLTAKIVVIATGSRPLIPPLKGIDTIDYLTNESLLELKEKPESLIIIGGGYIAVEFGHFFAAMGTRVTILEMAERLIMPEEPEFSELLKKSLSKRMKVYTNTQAEEVKATNDGVTVIVRDMKTNKSGTHSAQRIMVAGGRKSNADLLNLGNTRIELDSRGFIKVNQFFETTRKGIFAVGDANGLQMFTHAANRQASITAENILHGSRMKMKNNAIPHAIYSYPQIAAVGLKESDARKSRDVLVSTTKYFDVAMGEAMMEREGFAKVILEKETGEILGFHIIGPQASELIQEVTNAMTSSGNINEINNGLHIHPALSELIPATINNIEE